MGMISSQTKGLAFASTSAICWGTYGMFVAAFTRFGISASTIVSLAPTVLAVFFGLKVLTTNRPALKIRGKYLLSLAGFGLLFTYGQHYAYVKAFASAPLGIVSVMAFSHVILLMFTTRLFFGYQFTATKIVAVAAALLGVSLILRVFDSDSRLSGTALGWVALVPLVLACNYTGIKFYLTKGIEGDAILFYGNLFAVLFLWLATPPWALIADFARATAHSGPAVLLVLLAFAAVPQVISCITFFRAYRYIEPTYVSFCYALDPATSTLLGLFVLHQAIGMDQLAGMVIVVGAILFVQYREGQERAAPAPRAN